MDSLQNQSLNSNAGLNEVEVGVNLPQLIEVIIQTVIKVGETRCMNTALAIRDEMRRLPDEMVTEILNQLILKLIFLDPLLCRWFMIDVFLRDADPDARADVAERINVLLADLRSQQSTST